MSTLTTRVNGLLVQRASNGNTHIGESVALNAVSGRLSRIVWAGVTSIKDGILSAMTRAAVMNYGGGHGYVRQIGNTTAAHGEWPSIAYGVPVSHDVEVIDSQGWPLSVSDVQYRLPGDLILCK